MKIVKFILAILIGLIIYLPVKIFLFFEHVHWMGSGVVQEILPNWRTSFMEEE